MSSNPSLPELTIYKITQAVSKNILKYHYPNRLKYWFSILQYFFKTKNECISACPAFVLVLS